MTYLYRTVAIMLMAGSFAPRQKLITIHVLNGRNGKPIGGEHLLVTEGRSPEDVRRQTNHYDLRTDGHGVATLSVDGIVDSRIQVWVDFHVLCQQTPNLQSFSVREIVENGARAPNNCGSIPVKLGPGEFFVFARKPTLQEKLRR